MERSLKAPVTRPVRNDMAVFGLDKRKKPLMLFGETHTAISEMRSSGEASRR